MKMNTEESQKVIRVIENSNLSIRQVIELIENSNTKSKEVIDTYNEILLTVDYTKTLEEAIADGKYDWKNIGIVAKNFPISIEIVEKKIELATKLFHFNRRVSSEDATLQMDRDGYRSATLRELLVLGALNPELQKQFPIIALGSIWRAAGDDCCVVCLSVDSSGRKLSLYWFGLDWDARDRFLGVRK